MTTTLKNNIREARLIRQKMQQELARIPKKNRAKFAQDYFQLIKKAQQDDYCED